MQSITCVIRNIGPKRRGGQNRKKNFWKQWAKFGELIVCKGKEGNFLDDGNILYHNFGGGYTILFLFQNSLNYT